MPRKKSMVIPPRPRKGAELIVKANPGLDVKGADSDLGVHSGVFILGNRAGFRWLSDYFAWRAARIDEDDLFYSNDPDDHDHLAFYAPLNVRLSDEIDVMLGSFSTKHRRRVLNACRITRQRRVSGHLVTLFRSTLQFLRSMSADDRFRRNDAWPRAIAALRQLISEAEETAAELEAATKRGGKRLRTR
jgi:hypothetical protein